MPSKIEVGRSSRASSNVPMWSSAGPVRSAMCGAMNCSVRSARIAAPGACPVRASMPLGASSDSTGAGCALIASIQAATSPSGARAKPIPKTTHPPPAPHHAGHRAFRARVLPPPDSPRRHAVPAPLPARVRARATHSHRGPPAGCAVPARSHRHRCCPARTPPRCAAPGANASARTATQPVRRAPSTRMRRYCTWPCHAFPASATQRCRTRGAAIP